MKNLSILFVFFFSLTLSSNVFGQIEAQLAGHEYECEVDCFFTSCSMNCNPSQGGAVCTCAWGFATCGCGGNIDSQAEHGAINHQAIEHQRVALVSMGLSEMASILKEISATAKRGGDIRGLVKAYQTKADALPTKKQQQVRSLSPQ